MGYIWSFLRPLALFGVLYLVFSYIMRIDAPNYKLFLLLGIILWTFFSESTTAGMNALIANYILIRKINLPRIVLVLSAVSAQFVGLFFNLLVFLVFACIDGINWTWKMLYFFPVLFCLYILAIGVALFLSIIVVKIRDTNSLWEVAIQLGFWLTPIMYPMSKIPVEYRFYMFLNPMSGILEYSRAFLIGIGQYTRIGLLYVLAISIGILLAGILFFRWKEAEIVEEL